MRASQEQAYMQLLGYRGRQGLARSDPVQGACFSLLMRLSLGTEGLLRPSSTTNGTSANDGDYNEREEQGDAASARARTRDLSVFDGWCR